MLKEKKTWIKMTIALVFSLLIVWRIGYGQLETRSDIAVLQGTIQIHPVKPLPEDPKKIQPGTPVKISVTIENKGQVDTPDGELYVRYAFTKPLDNQAKSVLFQTEKISVASLKPGEKGDIQFSALQQLPSLFDFIRQDWAMREYQAIFTTSQVEKVIGDSVITFSAYYYPGLKHEILAEIPLEISQSSH